MEVLPHWRELMDRKGQNLKTNGQFNVRGLTMVCSLAPNPAGDFIPRPLLKSGEYSAFDADRVFLRKGIVCFFLSSRVWDLAPDKSSLLNADPFFCASSAALLMQVEPF
jgi:hypothetical protein